LIELTIPISFGTVVLDPKTLRPEVIALVNERISLCNQIRDIDQRIKKLSKMKDNNDE